VPGYQIHLASNKMEIAPGGMTEVAGTIHRELTFEGGEIRITAEDLPEKVTCPVVTVPATERGFKLRCEASAGAKAGSVPIRLPSAAPNTGRKAPAEYKIADIDAKLVIGESVRKAAR